MTNKFNYTILFVAILISLAVASGTRATGNCTPGSCNYHGTCDAPSVIGIIT